jgi:hypothetical protein
MIKDFRALLDNTQDAMHRVTIYNSTRDVLKHKSRSKTYISDEQPHSMELCIYHDIQVQVECLMVKAYPRFVDVQEARAGTEGTDGMTRYG